MFKLAFVCGIQRALINANAAAFPDDDTAIKIAEKIAATNDINLDQPVPREISHKVAREIVAASDWIKRYHPTIKAARFDKLGSWDDVQRAGDANAEQLMIKAAEGSTIEGGDKGNKEPTSAEGKMDMSQRPEGYATNSLGKTDVDTRPGTVGKEAPQPSPPSESPGGSNSVTEHSRTASIADLFRKAAEGSTIMGGDKGNKEPTTGEGKMDLAQRPPGYAVLPHQGAPGAMVAMIGGPAVIGKETPHPSGPSESPSGSNSVTQHSAKAAEDELYASLFKKVADKIVQYIPAELDMETKVAHVRACMGLTPDEQARYLGQLQADVKQASERAVVANASSGRRYDGRNANQRKAADDGSLPPFMSSDKKDDDKDDDKDKKDDKDKGGMPDFIQAKIDAKKDGDGDKDKKDDDEKKEAAMRDYVARVAKAIRAA